jgi:simple sugar transport system substrate-binding protein
MTRTSHRRVLRNAAVTALVLPLFLASCGSLEDEADTPEDGGTETAGGGGEGGDGPTIVTVPKLTGVSWFNRMGEGVDRYAEATGADAYMQGSGQADANAQVRVIEDLLAANVDALAVVPFQPDAVEQVLGQAMEDDVVVITHEAPGIENADWDLEAFRNEDYGRNLMDELAAGMGEEGEYALMVGSLSSATHMDWVTAAKEHQEENYPNMTHVGDIIETSDDSQIAYERMQEVLSAYPEIKGVQGSASTDVVGVGQAVDEAGLSEDITVVGTSVPNDARAGLGNGSIDLITFWDPADAGEAMNALAQAVIDGEEITDGHDLGVPGYESITIDGKVIYGDEAWITVTQDNVDEYDF